jgi:cobalamin synthase
VLGFNSKKSRERFYLLPGQGGRNFHRKQQRIMRWSILVAVVFGLILAVVMWCLARPPVSGA